MPSKNSTHYGLCSIWDRIFLDSVLGQWPVTHKLCHKILGCKQYWCDVFKDVRCNCFILKHGVLQVQWRRQDECCSSGDFRRWWCSWWSSWKKHGHEFFRSKSLKPIQGPLKWVGKDYCTVGLQFNWTWFYQKWTNKKICYLNVLSPNIEV